jgi:hypothetical protein
VVKVTEPLSVCDCESSEDSKAAFMTVLVAAPEEDEIVLDVSSLIRRFVICWDNKEGADDGLDR